MNYRVKIKGGLSIFHDERLAEKWAKKHKSKVEVIGPIAQRLEQTTHNR